MNWDIFSTALQFMDAKANLVKKRVAPELSLELRSLAGQHSIAPSAKSRLIMLSAMLHTEPSDHLMIGNVQWHMNAS